MDYSRAPFTKAAIAFFTLALLSALPRSVFAQSYKIVTIDPPSGLGYTIANGINNKGVVVGFFFDAIGQTGFAYDSATGSYTILDLETAPGTGLRVSYASANAINDSGIIAGHMMDDESDDHGFVYDSAHGSYRIIDNPENPDAGAASGIDNNGDVLFYPVWFGGTANDREIPLYGLATDAFSYIPIPQAMRLSAYGINNVGSIVGDYADLSGKSHHFLYDSVRGTFTNIRIPGLRKFSTVNAVNDEEVVVGSYSDVVRQSHGFAFDLKTSTFTDLVIPRSNGFILANGINDAGEIVGAYNDTQGRLHGFIAIPRPDILSFRPVSGSVGTTVTISGSGFSHVSAVRFHGIDVKSFVINSPTSITALVPARATTGEISVASPDGNAASTTAFTITAK